MNEITVVTEQDIPDILRMIHEIYSELPNKEWFSLDSDESNKLYDDRWLWIKGNV